ncbi:zf-HC2 domain-containing protein [Streptomyces sp. NBC_00893]|uniref:anti-sigma factor n=1 Tax=Streptomyces sp. NBC_00893 TaxID=2975862 RepID=UPI00224D1995|nr:zf-HC2 domain-containing protein [Streptomyces sp. NBC_00893]MCX4847688.1 zf-HC2 domain-containing protein [Streptomyces sp. NBC_00893]
MNDDHEWEPFGLRQTGPRSPSTPSSSRGPSTPFCPSGPRSPSAPSGPRTPVDPAGHDAAGAYLLGVLDDAEASAFEAHLAGCDLCAARLDELAGLEPVLARVSESPGAPAVRYVPGQPGPHVLERLVGEVTAGRARRRRRAVLLVAAAVALIIGGPVVAVLAGGDDGPTTRAAGPYPTNPTTSGDPTNPTTSGDPTNPTTSADPTAPTAPTNPAEGVAFHRMPEKVRATDPRTRVSATVGMAERPWGTSTVLELRNVTGPQKCRLIAVSRTGEEEVVTSWSVPEWGYGIEDSPYPGAKYPLYVSGGAAMGRGDIDHFEVRTFDGRRLVEVDA